MVCSIVSVGLQSKKKHWQLFVLKINPGILKFFFLWQRTYQKNVDFCLNTPNRQNWYFAHCHVHLWQTVSQYRFSTFWLRSKCSICSYQLNIWYGGHVPPSILNWFLQGDRVQELAPALSRVDLVLQYRQDRPTSPLTKKKIVWASNRMWMNEPPKTPKVVELFWKYFLTKNILWQIQKYFLSTIQ